MAAVIVAVGLGLLSRMGDPLGIRPDSWSEAEVAISGFGYAASGFLANAGLPQHQIGPPVDPYFLYANYPVLSNILYGLLHRLGADAHGLYRVPAILCSLLAVWLWYRVVTRVVDRPTGVAAAVALATSFGFLSYADNIHQQAYPLAPQFGAMLCFVIAAAPENAERRGPWLAGCQLCLLLVALLTIELHLWLLIALCGYALLFAPAVRKRWLLLLALPLGVGLVLQWLQSWAGSPVAAGDRPGLLEQLYRRSLDFAGAFDTPADAAGRTLSLATYPGFILARLESFYRMPFGVLVLLMLFAFLETGARRWPPQRWPAQMKLLCVLLAAGLGWMTTMMQQTAVHQAAMRQLLPFYALLLGTVWTQALRGSFNRRRHPLSRGLIAVCAAATLIPHLGATWSNIRMHWDHAYTHPLLAQPGWQESVDLAALQTLPARSVILTNHYRLPLIRYWSRRPTYLAPNTLIQAGQGQRSWPELTVNYLRGLYGGELPRLLYMYHVPDPTFENIQRALEADPLLRLLTTGSPDALESPAAQRLAARAFAGEVPAACPMLLKGRDWRVFDMTPAMPLLLRAFGAFPIPKLKDMPAPR